MTLFYTAIKNFEAAGGRVRVGDVVDATDWRTLPRLIEQRYLRVATEAEVALVTAPAEVAGPPTKRGKGAADAV